MKNGERGFSLQEVVLGMAIMAVLCAGFASMLKYVMKSTVSVQSQAWSQEETRQALAKIERALVHAGEVRVASSTFVEFVVDMDQRRSYDPGADLDGDGIPNERDGDRDGDASQLAAAANQWRIGFNLCDDDEDGDAALDEARRIYLEGSTLWLESSTNGAAWGISKEKLAVNISTFMLTYFGNKANDLGKSIDLGDDGVSGTGDGGENDGIVTAREMDWVPAAAGMGNRSGGLDLKNERRYITSLRLKVGLDKFRDAKTDYTVETDVYPPLLPLKNSRCP